MRTVYEIELPISADQADVIGMPAEYFERAVRQLGRLARVEDVVLDREQSEALRAFVPPES